MLTTVAPNGTVVPLATSGPTGYSPTQIRHAYGFDQISFNGGTADGSGETIAIVDAYDDPNIASDLHAFDVAFGLADPNFTKVNQNGGATLPRGNSGWATEIALDVEWAHAIAPKANILLVEASDASYNNLFAAVNYARNAAGVVAVSMSWGGSECSGETSLDGYLTTPANHNGVAFVVASGDSGAPAEYPEASPNVLSVGGTSLRLTSSNTISTESAWVDSTGGLSTYESEPAFQKGIVTQTTTNRATPDVSYDADPNTGFPVYDSYGTSAVWGQYGGTSDAAPQWSALIAIADQGRALAGLSPLSGGQLLTDIYQMPSGDFHDITSGSTLGSQTLPAAVGYDLATGRGTPAANLIVGALVGTTVTSTAATHFTFSPPVSTTAGNTFSLTVSALTAGGSIVTGYTGSVHFSSSDLGASLPADYTFTAVDNGTHTFTSLRLVTTGTQTIVVTDKATSTITSLAISNVTPGVANHLVFVQQPTSVSAGVTMSPAVTVRVLDAYNNLLTTDNSDHVTLSLGTNPGGGALAGTTSVTVSGGIATFNSFSISQPGSGYTIVASLGSLAITSSSFNVASAATTTSGVIEGFENGLGAYTVVGGLASAAVSTTAAHDGTYGLLDTNGSDWIYRNDSAAQVERGDTISVWVQFSGAANGRAYFGFGASAAGTLSLVAAPNTGQLLLQSNVGYGYTDIATTSQTWAANHWYRLEVDWGTSGSIVGKLFDSNGTTLLSSVSGASSAIASGGIAFRGFGSNKFWDTVSLSSAVNSFASSSSTSTSTSGIIVTRLPFTLPIVFGGRFFASQASGCDSQTSLTGQAIDSLTSGLTSRPSTITGASAAPWASTALGSESWLEESTLDTVVHGILMARKPWD